MASGKRKLKTLSIAEKVTVIRAVEKGDKKKVEIAKQFGIPTSTLTTFLKEKEKILKLYSEKSCGHQKRMRECEYPDIQQCVLEWFVHARDRNVPIDGKLLQAKAEDKRSLGIDLLEAMRMARKAWDEVPKETIKNCFKKAGFGQQTVDDSGDLEGMQMETDDALASPQEWSTVLTATGANKELSFQDFLEVDSAVNVCGELTDADIIAEVANEEQKEDESGDEEEDDKDGDTQPAPGRKEARQAIQTLRRFLESTPNLEENVFRSIDEIEEILERDASAHRRQTKLTDFFL